MANSIAIYSRLFPPLSRRGNPPPQLWVRQQQQQEQASLTVSATAAVSTGRPPCVPHAQAQVSLLARWPSFLPLFLPLFRSLSPLSPQCANGSASSPSAASALLAGRAKAERRPAFRAARRRWRRRRRPRPPLRAGSVWREGSRTQSSSFRQ